MKLLVLSIFLPLFLVFHVFATVDVNLEKEPFTEERFRELQEAGEVILIDVFADWCPTCARQNEILQKFRKDNPDKTFHVLEVNYDRDKKWVRHFRAPRLQPAAAGRCFWVSDSRRRFPKKVFKS